MTTLKEINLTVKTGFWKKGDPYPKHDFPSWLNLQNKKNDIICQSNVDIHAYLLKKQMNSNEETFMYFYLAEDNSNKENK